MNDDPRSSNPSDTGRTTGPGLLFQIKDNVEMIIVAFIMALVIRCFFVEVFKIPTGSMEPTLMGNNERTGEGGDRIMVNKFYYLFHSVDRFDVIVFRYPLNVMRNFIKRAVGIGPEHLRMQRGDIYHSKTEEGPFNIARKAFGKQQSIWIPLPPTETVPSGGDILDYWRFADSKEVGGDPDHLELEGSGSGGEQLVFSRPLRDMAVTSDRPQQSGNNRVKDLKISSVLSDVDPSDALGYQLTDGGFRFTLELNGSDPSRLLVHHENRERQKELTLNLASRLRSGRTGVSFFLYDGRVGLALNGELVREYTYRSTYDELNRDVSVISKRPRLVCREGAVRLHSLGLFRDIYYYWDQGVDGNFSKSREPIRIPDDRYLVVGDNVNSSRDSRKWKMKVVTLDSGEQVYVDQRNWNRALKTRRETVLDRSGRRFEISRLQARGDTRVAPMRFIRKELLVGKSIWVWWPYDRIKFIR